MTDDLDSIASQLQAQSHQQLQQQTELPPVGSWNPGLSGDIDIVIQRGGEWLHEGSPIKRHALVKLFASILRREDDGHYYLVTPVEKWRIRVEDQPLLIVDFDIEDKGADNQRVIVTTNVDRKYVLDDTYSLLVEKSKTPVTSTEPASTDTIPLVMLDNGIQARFDRPAYYRLVEAGEVAGDRLTLLSEGKVFTIGYL